MSKYFDFRRSCFQLVSGAHAVAAGEESRSPSNGFSFIELWLYVQLKKGLVLYTFKLPDLRLVHLKDTSCSCSTIYLYKTAVEELLALH